MADPNAVRVAALFLLAMVPPTQVSAQGPGKHSIEGNWVRVGGDHPVNNGMRITVDGTGAVLVAVPDNGSTAWSVGQLLWTAIRPDGTLDVRGSNGAFFESRFEFEGPDIVHVDIGHNGRGHDQTWRRAGPWITGEWVRVARAGDAEDSIRVQVRGTDAPIRYLPAAAPRPMRVGSQMWREIGVDGELEVLGRDGRYYSATATLIGTDSLRIDSDAGIIGSDVIWVRPEAVAGARLALDRPVSDPNLPGGDLTPPDDLPTVDVPIPESPPPSTRCVSTALPDHVEGLQWGWSLTSPAANLGRADTLGVEQHMVSAFTGARNRGRILTDLERFRLPGMDDGFSFVWQSRTTGGVLAWEELRDLTKAELDSATQSLESAGMMPSDVEGYATDGGTRYAGVWIANPSGIAWHIETDLTSGEYGAAFQNLRDAGYRLMDVEAYRTSSGLRFAGVWHFSCDNTNWRQVREMDREEYQQRLEDFREQGFRVTDFESYLSSAGQRYAAIWERVPPGRGWRVRTDRTLQWFLNYHRRYEDVGLRLIDVESYETENGLRYAGVWAENDDRFDMPFRVALTDSLEAYRTQFSIPGISVVAMWNGRVIYQHGVGWADSAQSRTANSQTIYLTASVAKVLGATMAARLEEQGRIDLSKPTRDFLPDLPDHHIHTVDQLLAKVGCVWHYGEGPMPDTTRFYRTRDDILDQIQDGPLLTGCEPGEQYHYSTHGFTFVDAVLEEVLDKDIAAIFKSELTQPFDLPSMRTVTPGTWATLGDARIREDPPYHMAQAYRWDANTGLTQARSYENSTWKIMGGGLQTNAVDLARFGWLTLNGDIVSADTRDNRLWAPMFDSTTTNWEPPGNIRRPPVGLAWNIRNSVCVGELAVTSRGGFACGFGQPTARVAEHGGVASGARSQLQIYRDLGLVIAIMTNQRNHSVRPCGGPFPQPSCSHPIGTLADQIGRIIMRDPPPGA